MHHIATVNYALIVCPISIHICTHSIKYLSYMFSSNDSDDVEIMRQMRLLYCRSYRLIRMFTNAAKNVVTKLRKNFRTTFRYPYFRTLFLDSTVSTHTHRHPYKVFSKLSSCKLHLCITSIVSLSMKNRSASAMFMIINIKN